MEFYLYILIYIVFAIAVCALLFILFRSLMLWYWRINDIILRQENIIERLDLMREDLAKYHGVNPPTEGEHLEL